MTRDPDDYAMTAGPGGVGYQGAGRAEAPHVAATQAGAMNRHAAEWGLASLLLGAMLSVTALLMLVLNVLLGTMAPQIMGPGDVHLATVGACFGVAAVVGVASFGMAAASFGLTSAIRRRQPAALPLAGIVACALALLLWLVATVDLFMVLDLMRRVAGG
jgi:hypothetical protein